MLKNQNRLIQLVMVLSVIAGSILFLVFFGMGERLGKILAGLF